MIKHSLWNAIPSRNCHLYALCKRYVDRYNSENNDNIHTNGEWRFMQTILPQCATVFDVGANVGDWTALALDINPRLVIHCFEPSVATFQRLQARGQYATILV